MGFFSAALTMGSSRWRAPASFARAQGDARLTEVETERVAAARVQFVEVVVSTLGTGHVVFLDVDVSQNGERLARPIGRQTAKRLGDRFQHGQRLVPVASGVGGHPGLETRGRRDLHAFEQAEVETHLTGRAGSRGQADQDRVAAHAGDFAVLNVIILENEFVPAAAAVEAKTHKPRQGSSRQAGTYKNAGKVRTWRINNVKNAGEKSTAEDGGPVLMCVHMMVNVMRSNQRWLWILISVLVSISFISFYSDRTHSDAVGTDQVGKIYGRTLTVTELQRTERQLRVASELGLTHLTQREIFEGGSDLKLGGHQRSGESNTRPRG